MCENEIVRCWIFLADNFALLTCLMSVFEKVESAVHGFRNTSLCSIKLV